jgi:nuclear transcription factor Y gamma
MLPIMSFILCQNRMDHQGHNQNPPRGSVGSADQWPFGFMLCQPNKITGEPVSVGEMQATGQPAGAQLGQQQQHNQNSPMEVVGNINQRPFGFMPSLCQPNEIIGSPRSVGGMQSTGQPAGAQLGPIQLAYQLYFHRQQQEQLQQQLQAFWANQYKEVEKVTDFNNHSLPLAGIEKIMKTDEDVRMIADEAPVILAKACEMFILDLTMRSRNQGNTRTLQKNDIGAAVAGTDYFDFLLDTVPHEKVSDTPVFQFPGNFCNGGGCQTVNPEGPLLPSETVDDSVPVFPAFQIIEADKDIKEENYD